MLDTLAGHILGAPGHYQGHAAYVSRMALCLQLPGNARRMSSLARTATASGACGTATGIMTVATTAMSSAVSRGAAVELTSKRSKHGSLLTAVLFGFFNFCLTCMTMRLCELAGRAIRDLKHR